MPDITLCQDNKCPRRELCYRAVAKASYWQSYFGRKPCDDYDTCKYFMEIDKKNKASSRSLIGAKGDGYANTSVRRRKNY